MSPSDESVSQLMSTPVVTVVPSLPVGELLRLAESLEIHHFPIVDDTGLYGLVCTCDVDSARPEQTIAQFARRVIITVSPDGTAREAAALMAEHHVGSIVIADNEGVWGILTREDLAETVPEVVRRLVCGVCGSRQHLRHRRDGSLLCPACAANEVHSSTD